MSEAPIGRKRAWDCRRYESKGACKNTSTKRHPENSSTVCSQRPGSVTRVAGVGLGLLDLRGAPAPAAERLVPGLAPLAARVSEAAPALRGRAYFAGTGLAELA